MGHIVGASNALIVRAFWEALHRVISVIKVLISLWLVDGLIGLIGAFRVAMTLTPQARFYIQLIQVLFLVIRVIMQLEPYHPHCSSLITSTTTPIRGTSVMASKLTPEILAAPGTEHAHQRAFFAAISTPEFCPPALRPPAPARLCFAIPNGGARDVITAGRLKAEGVKAGVPDVCCPVARWRWHSLYLEFK